MLVDARWDTTQFLHELAGRPETLETFKACFANIDADVAGWWVLNALMPALASCEMREALNRECTNLVFTELLAPSCARALDALGDRLSLRTDLLDVGASASTCLASIRSASSSSAACARRSASAPPLCPP
mmetsp:Transcript_27547/g.69485  ORF Transcript_27547/g.69485 Transcript_27547/m.69485 type:complete len:131 (+) Transcript_27547:464-856(+)